MRVRYDFSKGIRGKYSERSRKGTNVVVLEPDVAKEFPDAASINEALRDYLRSKKRPRGKT